jgi:hypothetical protein
VSDVANLKKSAIPAKPDRHDAGKKFAKFFSNYQSQIRLAIIATLSVICGEIVLMTISLLMPFPDANIFVWRQDCLRIKVNPIGKWNLRILSIQGANIA